MQIRAENLLDQISERTFLSQGYAANVGTLNVKNINAFSPSWAVQIGETSQEQAEVQLLGTAAISGGSLVLAGSTRFPHSADTPIYAIKYDQAIFKRSTSGTSGTATALGTVSITPDSAFTLYEDTTSTSTSAYKVQWKNSVTGDLSSESDWFLASGYTFYSKAKLRDRVKGKLVSAGYLKTDDVIDDWVNEWLETMNNVAIDVNQDYSLGTVDVAYGTNGLGTITSSDFKEIRKIDFTTDGVTYFTGNRIGINMFLPQQTFAAADPKFYMLGDSVFGKLPKETPGTARITYYKLPALLTNDSDELPTSMKGYTKSFVDYALSQAYYLDGKEERGDRFMAMANAGLEKFRSEITPRSMTGPHYIRTVESVNIEDDFNYMY